MKKYNLYIIIFISSLNQHPLISNNNFTETSNPYNPNHIMQLIQLQLSSSSKPSSLKQQMTSTYIGIKRQNVTNFVYSDHEDSHDQQQQIDQKLYKTHVAAPQTTVHRNETSSTMKLVIGKQLARLKPSFMSIHNHCKNYEEDDYLMESSKFKDVTNDCLEDIKSHQLNDKGLKNKKEIQNSFRQQQQCSNIVNVTVRRSKLINLQCQITQSDQSNSQQEQLQNNNAINPQKQHENENSSKDTKEEHHNLDQFQHQSYPSQQNSLNQSQTTQTLLLEPSELVQSNSKYFLHQLQTNLSFSSSIIDKPFRPHTVHTFQIHIYTTIIDKIFELWLPQPNKGMILLMRASKSINILQTSYQIQVRYRLTQCMMIPTYKIISNLQRNQYNLEYYSQNHQLIGTIANSITIQNHKNLVLYFPRVNQDNTTTNITKHHNYSNLRTCYREYGNEDVDYWMTTHLSAEKEQSMMEKYGWKQSDKSMQLKLLIGKKGSKRYELICGSGISPIQLFSLAIVNIETS